MALADLLRVLSVFLAGITTGGMVFVYATISPIMAASPVSSALELHAAMLRYDPDRYIKPAGVVAFLSSIAVLFADQQAQTASLVLDGAGVVGFLGVVVISEGGNVPINRRVAKWPPDAPPEDYEPMRARWLSAHAWRTLCGVVALACLSTSLAVR